MLLGEQLKKEFEEVRASAEQLNQKEKEDLLNATETLFKEQFYAILNEGCLLDSSFRLNATAIIKQAGLSKIKRNAAIDYLTTQGFGVQNITDKTSKFKIRQTYIVVGEKEEPHV